MITLLVNPVPLSFASLLVEVQSDGSSSTTDCRCGSCILASMDVSSLSVRKRAGKSMNYSRYMP